MSNTNIRLSNIREIFFVFFLVFFCCDVFTYNLFGSYSSLIKLSIFILTGLYIFLIKNIGFNKKDAICLLISFVVLLYTNSTESIRYFLTLILIIIWQKIDMPKVELLIELIIIVGILRGFYQVCTGVSRITGFDYLSPTQFSANLLICESYLAVCMVANKFSYKKMIFIICCLILMFFSETRSTLFAGLCIFAVSLWIAFFSKLKKITKILGMLILVICVWVTFANVDKITNTIVGGMNRINTEASNETRKFIYTHIISELKSNPLMLLLGKGGGYTEIYLKRLLHKTSYFPAHQDFLVIICEYGVVGLIVLWNAFLKSHKFKYFFLFNFIVFSFHNVILSPVAIFLLVITTVDLEHKKYLLINELKFINKRIEIRK